MNRSWKISLTVLFFGTLTLLGGILFVPKRQEYAKAEILGTRSQVTAFVEPDDGIKPILDRVQTADEEILVEVYLISDPEIISSLVLADKRGVEVKVILEARPFGGNNLNQKSKKTLEEGGVEVQWGRKIFRFTHVKAITFDKEESCILNTNLSTSAFNKNREFSVCTQDAGEVGQLRDIFLADWNGTDVTITESNLVVSPVDSRGKLLSLIRQAKNHIEMVMEVLDDDEATAILMEKSRVMSVRILVPPPEQILANKDAAIKIGRSEGWVRTLNKPYLHGKLIIVDGERAYVGSVNLTKNSFDKNREVGIIVSDPHIVQRFLTVFETDWQVAQEYQ